MALALLRFYQREAHGPKLRILGTSLASGLSRGLLLATINAAVEQSDEAGRYGYLIAFLAFLAAYLFTSHYSLTRAQSLAEGLTQHLRMRICDKLLYAQLRFVETKGHGQLYARLTQDINRLSSAAITFINTFQSVVLLVFCLGYIGWLSPLGLLVTLVTIVAGVGTYLLQDKSATAYTRRVREKETEFFDAIGDMLRGFKELKINRGKRNASNEHVTGISHTYRDLSIRAERLFIVSFLTSQTFMFGLIAVLVFVLPQFLASNATLIFQFLAAILFLIGPLEGVVSSIPSITRGNVALERVRGLESELDATIAEDEDRKSRVRALGFQRISLAGVGYAFGGRHSDDAFALGPLDLEIRRGEILFLVGGNGSGKTTLMKVLTGLYMPSHGALMVDGKPLATHDYQAYREMFTTIFSDFHLFPQLYGVEQVDLDLLTELLARLELSAKTHYQDGRFTTIDLSTGQRKRLAFTTAYLEDKQIYVFDEFAADQDPGFRKLFYRTLLPELKRRGKTVIAVTHDDNYFDACDRLVKLDYGRIASSDNQAVVEIEHGHRHQV